MFVLDASTMGRSNGDCKNAQEPSAEENMKLKEPMIKDVEDVITLGTDLSYKHQIIWSSAVVYILLHFSSLIGFGLCLLGRVSLETIIWSIFYSYVATEGAHLAAHRCFSHRSFKAKPPLKVLLLIMQAISGQQSAYIWARDHRQHHRYSDTDADPHNANRGFWYSHIGWLVTRRHPLCKKMRKTIDISDLHQDKLIMFQYKYYLPIFFIFGVVLPIFVPMYFFNESFLNSFLVSFVLRYTFSLNVTLLVNSIAHMYGTRPFDKNLMPVESYFVSLLTLGEGWHNYHHAFPWDYKAAEINMPFNFTSSLIRLCESLGLAYDLKTLSPEMLHNRIKRCGDGTYQLEDLSGLVKAYGPLHPLNPTYHVKYPNPDVTMLYKPLQK